MKIFSHLLCAFVLLLTLDHQILSSKRGSTSTSIHLNATTSRIPTENSLLNTSSPLLTVPPCSNFGMYAVSTKAAHQNAGCQNTVTRDGP